MEISARLEMIRERMAGACRRVGREIDSVRLVAVAKTRTPDEIRLAVEAGVRIIGENRVQEAERKQPELENLEWHLVGHLQKNKVKKAIELFELIHSVDSVDLARRVDRLASEMARIQRVLLQVDLAGETTKYGLAESEVIGALESFKEFSHLKVEGLMVLPPFHEDPQDARPYFRRLRVLGERAQRDDLIPSLELSMGMSHDFEVAIEEGSTYIRIGTALFGERRSRETTSALV
ncbi:MAG TPA: YggS family pyridoxal phosphate-dependent enzyme [Vicinamibacteria bacterium]|nr:YggS family pyridoxal phosphate-dependent enzyme [Vicinamibacteria bacterium]